MKTILIPIDFQGDTTKQFKYIQQVFRNEPVSLELIYVADPAKQIVHDAIDTRFKTLEETVLKSSSIPYSFSIVKGNIVEQLQDAIDRFKPSLLMIGVQGTRLIRSLVRLVNCPVYIIPHDTAVTTVQSILYAHDFNSIQDSSALQRLWELAKAHHSTVHVLHIVRDDAVTEDKGEPALEYYLDQIPHEYATVVSNNFVSAINTYIEKKQMDLLVLLLREHGHNANNSKGELVEELLTASNIPMLILV
ncbi:MAG: universal stress protein [Cyclobacteriaceae bacterium]|nr:universal stress protein [Cyclobacteriaceae bacterium]